MYVKFDENQKFTRKQLKDQEISDNLDDFEDAGYILTDEELVVDIDNLSHETIKAMIDTFNIHTKTVWTDRGVHLYFKKPIVFRRAKGMTALGFKVEYKHSGNTYALTVKRNGVARKVENEGVLKQIPNFLLPIKGKNELLGLEEGDERNNALYAHKRKVFRMGNEYKILKFINEHIFAVPLSEAEFESVARDEVFEAEKDGESVVADLIIKEHKAVVHNGMLYYFDQGSYITDDERLKRLVYDYCPGQKTHYVDEVIKQLKYRAEMIPTDKKFKIRLRNGYLYEGKFFPYSYLDFTPYFIDINYDPNAEPVAEVEDYLNQLSKNDEDYRNFILEVIATALITDNQFKRHLAKFFIFVGDGGNGKGTLLHIITRILGSENVAANSITELTDERYCNTLVGKLANLGDDLTDTPINRKEMKTLKNLSTGDLIQIRRLYENAVSVRLNPVLIFTSNHILKTFDKDYSYKRRVLWCPMYTKPKVAQVDFITKLTTDKALKYWMRLIVEAYQRIYQNGEYTHSDIVERFNKNYHRENNNTIEYVEQLKDEEIEDMRPTKIYEDYKAWCETNGESPLSDKQLRSQILSRGYKVMPIKRKTINDGKSFRVYRKLKESS